MIERLDAPDTGARIREEMLVNLVRRGGPEALLITGPDSPYRGRTLAGISGALERDPVEAAIRVIADGDPSVASFVMDPTDIATLAVQPWVMTASDGGRGHPRFFATYPKAWQDFVRSGLLSVERFVHRSSGQVAETFGICDRGFLRPGYVADVALLDPDDYLANATFEDPTAISSGVRYLFVNGTRVIDSGDYTDALPGQVLRHGGCPQRYSPYAPRHQVSHPPYAATVMPLLCARRAGRTTISTC